MGAELQRCGDIDAILSGERPANPLAHKIGAHSLAAFLGVYDGIHTGADTYRKKLGKGRKVWETSPAYLHLKGRLRQSHVFTLITPRRGRERPSRGCLVELIHNGDYASPLAHIKTPSGQNEGVVVANGVANDQQVLEQIWPIIRELNGSRILSEFQIPIPSEGSFFPAE